MRTERIGERLIVIEDCGERAVRLRDAIEAAAIPGVEEVVPCYESVGLIVDPERFEEPSLEALLRAPLPVSRSEPKRVEVPVCYELGEDLAEVCGILGLSSEEFISATRTPSTGALRWDSRQDSRTWGTSIPPLRGCRA